MVSIIMPLFNKGNEVNRSLQSALSQSFADFEIIVVNDGSTDRGPEIADSFGDQRIRLVHQSNRGVSSARNRGIAEARAEFISFLDADDEWEKDYLETILRLADNFPEASVFATGYLIKEGGRDRRVACIRGLPDGFSEGMLDNYFVVAADSDPPLWTSAVTVRKSAIESVGGFLEGIAAGEDLLTWAQLAVRYKIAYCRSPRAVFYAPRYMEDRPSRSPQIPDHVASGLRALLSRDSLTPADINGLHHYIGVWHRMRAVVYIKLNRGLQAREEIRISSSYSGMTVRLFLLLLLSWLPYQLPAKIYYALLAASNLIRSRR